MPSRFYSNDYAAVGYKYGAQSNEILELLRCVHPEYLDVLEFKCIADDDFQASPRLARKRLAVSKCGPGTFKYGGRYCVDECPAEEGYYFDGSVNENDVNEC